MNPNWFLRSKTVSWALALSGVVSALVLLLSPDGLPQARKRQKELQEAKRRLVELHRRNQATFEEVKRLAAQDPELMEALARRMGYVREGEEVITFKEERK